MGIIGTNQLFVDITDVNGRDVNFRFTNAVGTPCSITAIYFDDFDDNNYFDDISND